MADIGLLEVDATKLQLDLCGALHDFLALFKHQPGLYYPIFGHFGDTRSGNILLLAAMGFVGEKPIHRFRALRLSLVDELEEILGKNMCLVEATVIDNAPAVTEEVQAPARSANEEDEE
jgi:hypothetical protein